MLCQVGAFFVFAPLSLIHSWKRLAPLSLIANVCMFAGIVVAMSYVFAALFWGTDTEPLNWVPERAVVEGAPLLYGALVYSFELVCAVLPIE